MGAAAHYVCELIRVVFVTELVYLYGVKVKQVDELGKELHPNKPVLRGGSRILLVNKCFWLVVVMRSYYWLEHFVYLIGVTFAFEKSKEHSFENFGRNNTTLVFNQLIELLPEIVENP